MQPSEPEVLVVDDASGEVSADAVEQAFVDRTVFRLRQRLWRRGPERLDAVEGELRAL
jgi:hypothetical protein